ncbi:MAG TPA: hypothetical protein VK909_06785 [Anaerolineales bacterium]|nr:hypothetical protein [Anaerolineales bacterium]
MKRVVVLVFTLVLMGCSSGFVGTPPAETSLPSTASEANNTLINFLTLLHTKNYTDAVPLFGGDYEQLQVFNPDIDANDHLALWTWACDHQLLQCLEVRSTTFKQQVGDSYIFQVEFNNPDGSRFVLGPCCGANETEMPPVSQFEFTVIRNADGKFQVMNMPPYVP